MRYALIILHLIIFSSCQNNANQFVSKNESIFYFDLGKDFKITSYQKVIEVDPETDLSACKGWDIDKQDLKKIMQSMKSIQGEEWHHLFSHLACEINGELIQNKNTFKYSINSGSWMSVYTQDTTMWFGDINKTNEALFMDVISDMENE